MTKQIVAIGSRVNGKTTIIYTGHAVALWSELSALIPMIEAAKVPGMDKRITSAKLACDDFINDWAGDDSNENE